MRSDSFLCPFVDLSFGITYNNSWGHKELDTTERLNWNELICYITNTLFISTFTRFMRSSDSDSKESAWNAADPGLILGSGRSSGERNGYLLQCSCLENPMNRSAWWAAAHGVTRNRTWLSDFHFTLLGILFLPFKIIATLAHKGDSCK